jgi:Rab GDP dissociation inhibitor
MLNTPVDEILFDANGKVYGIKSTEGEAKAPLIICDPTYAHKYDKVTVVGKQIRSICILDHPLPNTNNATSCQIILPQKQLGRQFDIYVNMVSFAHAVCGKGLYLAMVSTTVETANPEAEIQPALELLGPVLEQFVSVSDSYAPKDFNSSKDSGVRLTF